MLKLMLTKFRFWAYVVIIAAILGIVAKFQYDLNKAEANARDAGLAMLNAQADAKMIRNVMGQMVMYVRQVEIQRDSLDEALAQRPVVKVALEGTITPLDTNIVGEIVAAEPTDSIRTAEFNFYDPPFRLLAQIVVPKPPAEPTGRFNVSVDPIPVGVRIGCGEQQFGVRPALVSVASPSYLITTVAGVEQAPEVCNPSITVQSKSMPLWQKVLYGGTILAGGMWLGKQLK